MLPRSKLKAAAPLSGGSCYDFFTDGDNFTFESDRNKITGYGGGVNKSVWSFRSHIYTFPLPRFAQSVFFLPHLF